MVILGVFSLMDLREQERQITEEDKIKATLVTDIIKNGLITIMLEARSEDLRDFIETLVADDLGAVRLYRPDGEVIASSIPSEAGNKVEGIDPSIPFEPELKMTRDNRRPVYNIKIPFYNERPCQMCHSEEKDILSILSVSVSMEKTLRRVRDMRKRSALYFILTLGALSAALGIMTTFLVNKPVERVIETMREVETGNMGARFSSNRSDEIGALGKGLNSMLSELGRMRHEVESFHIEAMQKVEKMATIGELAAAIAHEIKNPLAGISGAIQVIAEEMPEDDPRREVIKEVQHEVERLDKSVRDLLSYARPPKPHFTKIPLDSLIDRSTALVMNQARKQNVRMNIVSPDEPVDVYVDVEQIQQVFLNIMLNALHSMPGGGSLTISTYVRPEKNQAGVSIADTGPGISRENITEIFKPFFTTKHTSSGLGLAISKNIIETHGGDITVESTVGVGSNFHIILPLEDKRPEEGTHA